MGIKRICIAAKKIYDIDTAEKRKKRKEENKAFQEVFGVHDEQMELFEYMCKRERKYIAVISGIVTAIIIQLIFKKIGDK